MKRLLLGAALAALIAVPLLAQVANVTSGWVGGNLVYRDLSGNIIFTIDGTNRKIEIPSGSVLDLDAATTTVVLAAGSIDADDIATSGVATAEILNGTILDEDIGAAAGIVRTKLAENALQDYPAELKSAAGAGLLSTETAGSFNVSVAAGVINIEGEITDNETETSVGWFAFVLPPEYVAAGDVSVHVRSALVASAAPTDNGSTVDVACFEQADGAVGADLSTTTSAGTWAALDTYETDDFVITATGLVAGDLLHCSLTAAVIDSEAGGGTITFTADPITVLLDVQG